MIEWNRIDTDCKNEWAIFTRSISFTDPTVKISFILPHSLYEIMLKSTCFKSTESLAADIQLEPHIITPHNVCSLQWRISWVPWEDIMNTVGDILSNVGDVQYRGGCHDNVCLVSWGYSVPWGISRVPLGGGGNQCRGGDLRYRGRSSVL